MWRNWWPGRREQEEKEEERKEEGKEREEESGESRQEKGVHGGDQSVSAWVKGFESECSLLAYY